AWLRLRMSVRMGTAVAFVSFAGAAARVNTCAPIRERGARSANTAAGHGSFRGFWDTASQSKTAVVAPARGGGTIAAGALSHLLPPTDPVMRTLFAMLFALAPILAVAQEKKDPPPKKEAPIVNPREGKNETIKLFDGKSLEGWEGYSDLWSVKDGVIVAKNT